MDHDIHDNVRVYSFHCLTGSQTEPIVYNAIFNNLYCTKKKKSSQKLCLLVFAKQIIGLTSLHVSIKLLFFK